MAQIREDRFRVKDISDDEVTLQSLSAPAPVIVESQHEEYTGEIQEAISILEENQTIEAQIQSEDILQPNSIWRFIEIRHR